MYQSAKTEANNQGLACSRLPATWITRMAASKDRAGHVTRAAQSLHRICKVLGLILSHHTCMHNKANGKGWEVPGKLGCSVITDNTDTLETEYSALKK